MTDRLSAIDQLFQRINSDLQMDFHKIPGNPLVDSAVFTPSGIIG